ncbi:hypothetical protein [Bacillus pseudomycoides]|nr:hypothetical protein [Bacillus pseudomycoides]
MNRQPGLKKSQLLIELAKHSVGTQQALKIYKLHLEQLFEEFDLATSQLERVEKEVTDILKEIPLARKLLALRNEKGLRNFKMMPIELITSTFLSTSQN